MTQYRRFAEVYDRMGADRFSITMAGQALKLVRRFDVEVNRGLDLCCGTGSAIEYFADHGFAMSGLDGSREMLAVARKKLAGRGIRLYHQSLPRFAIHAGPPRWHCRFRHYQGLLSFRHP